LNWAWRRRTYWRRRKLKLEIQGLWFMKSFVWKIILLTYENWAKIWRNRHRQRKIANCQKSRSVRWCYQCDRTCKRNIQSLCLNLKKKSKSRYHFKQYSRHWSISNNLISPWRNFDIPRRMMDYWSLRRTSKYKMIFHQEIPSWRRIHLWNQRWWRIIRKAYW